MTAAIVDSASQQRFLFPYASAYAIAYAIGASCGYLLGGFFWASVVGIAGGSFVIASLTIKSARTWPLTIVALYVLFTFGYRPGYTLVNPGSYEPRIGVARADLNDPYAIAGLLAALGFGMLLVGFEILAPRPARARYTSLRVPTIAVMISFVALELICGLLLLRVTGGLVEAFSNIKTIREELAGQRLPLLGIWSAQIVALYTFATWRRCAPATRLLACLILVAGTILTLSTGSRGGAVPFLIGAAVCYVAGDRERKQTSLKRQWGPAARLTIIAVPILVSMLIFGGYKQFATPTGSGSSASSVADAITSVTYDQIAAQFKDSDYFATAIIVRDDLPDGGDLAMRVLGAPLTALPSGLGLPKPRPYDYDLRAVAVGGIVETGLPASLFGELWLIGGVPALVVASLVVGLLLRRLAETLDRPTSPAFIFGAIAMGWLYLALSRPLVISVSRLMIFAVAFGLATWIVLRFGGRTSAE